jgi:hypothetical protein
LIVVSTYLKMTIAEGADPGLPLRISVKNASGNFQTVSAGRSVLKRMGCNGASGTFAKT